MSIVYKYYMALIYLMIPSRAKKKPEKNPNTLNFPSLIRFCSSFTSQAISVAVWMERAREGRKSDNPPTRQASRDCNSRAFATAGKAETEDNENEQTGKVRQLLFPVPSDQTIH